jgi:tripartite-type tricarboxylate transporter receptor subunit TctC
MKKIFRRMAILVSTLLMLSPAFAQGYPAKTITLVVGFGPGGNADIVARIVAQKMTDTLGQPIVVENRGGAGGLLANDSVAKAPPDGYRLSLISGAFTAQAAALPKLPFDPQKDFTWVSTLISYPLVVVVPAESPHKTLDDMIKFAQANPKKLNYPSPGNGSLFHLATEVFSSAAGIEMTHVPFRGGAQQLTELLGGRLDVMFDTLAVVQPQLKAGKLRALAVTSTKRMPQLPGVPAVAEKIPGYEASSFLGIAGPAAMPETIVQLLNKATASVLANPELKQRFAELGGDAWAGTPAEMGNYIMTSTLKWKTMVRAKDIKAD